MSEEPNNPIDNPLVADLSRYDRQMRFAPLGEAGQRRLAAASALVCGCGALGSVIAELLTRAGVGRLRIVDRDFLELSNLQRQVLFDEADVAANLPKAIAAANKLRAINSQIVIEPIVADVEPGNVCSLIDGMQVIVDGTDNFETRFLLNDAALKHRIPWIYGGCIGDEGQTMTILPGETSCLRCLLPESPPPGAMPTCDTAGILGPIVNVIASLEANEAIKILSGRRDAVSRSLTICDLWENRFRQIKLDRLAERSECDACQKGKYEWLQGDRWGQSNVLCGRNAVQVHPHTRAELSLAALAEKLSGVGDVTANSFLLRCRIDGYVLTVFADGRAIVSGTADVAAARSIYSRYVGA